MDVKKFLLEGNVTPNPAYNPKTKKGAIEPPLLVDNTPGNSEHDNLMGLISRGVRRTTEDVSEFVGTNYADYNVIANSRSSIDDLNRERAENQGAGEQLLRSIGQALYNEGVVGMALGAVNLVDFFANIGNKENDYTNSVSQSIEEYQDKIRENWEIYRTDPDKQFDLKDFGWWANGMVTVGSTLSLLIPSTAAMKGLSYLSNVTRANKLLKNVIKLTGKTTKGEKWNNTRKTYNTITGGLEIATSSFLSRTMENYQEARGVYKEVYDNTLNKLNQMANNNDATGEYSKFIERNPEFEGLSNEEISKKIASESGNRTMTWDYGMLVMDALQFKALKNMWKFPTSKQATASVRGAQQKALDQLAGKEVQQVTKGLGKIVDKFKNPYGWFSQKAAILRENPMAVAEFLASNVGEGFEEGYQGVMTEKGKEVAEKYLDPDFTPRTLNSYLNDYEIWEQAFWGFIGGITFQIAGSGLGRAYNAAAGTYKYLKDRDNQESYINALSKEEKIRTDEIKGRQAKLDSYLKKRQQIIDNQNPFVTNNDGSPVAIKNDSEKNVLLERLQKEYATDIAIAAARVGNYDLLKDFINSEEFNEYTKSDTGLQNVLINEMDKVVNDYYNYYDNLMELSEAEEGVAGVVATELVRNKQNIDIYDKAIKETLADLIAKPEYQALDEEQKEKVILKTATHQLKLIDEAISNMKLKNEAGVLGVNSIGKTASKHYLKELNKKRRAILDYIKENTSYVVSKEVKEQNFAATEEARLRKEVDVIGPGLEKVINDFYKFVQSKTGQIADKGMSITRGIEEQISEVSNLELQKGMLESNIPIYEEDYKDVYEEYHDSINKHAQKTLTKSLNRVIKYINDAENINDAVRNILNEENLNNELRKDVQRLKIGAGSTQIMTATLKAAVDNIIAERNKSVSAPSEVVADENPLGEDAAKTESEGMSEDIPSTGEEVKSNTDDNTDGSTDKGIKDEITPGEEIVLEGYEVAPEIIGEDEEAAIYNADEGFREILSTDNQLIASTVVRDKFIELMRDANTRTATEAGIRNGVESKEFNDLLNILIDEVRINVACSIEEARRYTETALKSTIELVIAHDLSSDKSLINPFKNIVNELSTRISIGENSAIDTITDIQYKEKVVELIKELLGDIKPIDGIYYVNLEDIFKAYSDRAKKENISMDKVRLTFVIMKEVFNNSNFHLGDNYKLINTEVFKQDIDSFFSRLEQEFTTIDNIDNYMHLNITSKAKTTPEIYNSLLQGKLNVRYNEKKTGIIFSANDIDVAYIATVVNSSTNDEYELLETTSSSKYINLKNTDSYVKLRTSVKQKDGKLNLNIDTVLESIIRGDDRFKDSDRAYDLLYKFFMNRNTNNATPRLTTEEYKEFLGLDVIKYFINPNNKFCSIPEGFNEDDEYAIWQKAANIMNVLNNIIFFKGNNVDFIGQFNRKYIYNSYQLYKSKVYDNYTNTRLIQEALNKNEKDNLGKTSPEKLVVRVVDTSTQKLLIDPIAINNISEVNLNRKMPFVIVDDKGQVISEDGNIYNNKAKFTKGTAGVLVKVSNGSPLIAAVTKSLKVKDGNIKLKDAAVKEFKTILKEYFDDKNNLNALDILYDKLKGIVGYGSNNIFKGYKIIYDKNKGILGIKYNNENKKYAAVFYKYDNGIKFENNAIVDKKTGRILTEANDKDAINKHISKAVIYKKDGEGKSKGFYENYNAFIEAIGNDFGEHIEFNITGFTVKNNNKLDAEASPYMFKKDGNLIIKFGDYQKTYSNFTEFAIDNNAFLTTQGVDDNGNLFDRNDLKGIYVDVKSVSSTEEFKQVLGTRIREGNKTDSIPVSEIVDIAGFGFLNRNIFGEPLIGDKTILPENIYYDAEYNSKKNTTEEQKLAKAYHKNGKIYITEKGIEYISGDNSKILRLLLHENLHAKIASTKFFDGEIGTIRAEELYDCYKQFVNEILNYDGSSPIGELTINEVLGIKDWTSKYFIAKNVGALNKDGSINTKKFMNEFLAEVISQPILAKYLNNIEYKGSINVSNKSRKSLLAKILDYIVNLFKIGGGNIKENTILAGIYQILNNNSIGTIKPSESNKNVNTESEVSDIPTTENTNTDNTISPVEGETTQLEIEFTEDTNEEIDENEDIEDDLESPEDDYSIISDITTAMEDNINEFIDTIGNNNPAGIMIAPSMDDFVQMFRPNDRSVLTSAIENNELSYSCQ